MVARDMPSAPMRWSGGIVSPISVLRMTRSLGRTSPLSPASASTHAGASSPVKASSIKSAARIT